MDKAINYTPEQEAELVQRYEAGETAASLAEWLGKSEKSVIAKLSRLNVYKPTKPKGAPRATKAQMVSKLEDTLGLECGNLLSIEKADRAALEALLGAVLRVAAT